MAAIGSSLGLVSVFYRILEKKKKLIDTGFSGFSGYLDKVVRGRELVFRIIGTPWLAGAVVHWIFGCLD